MALRTITEKFVKRAPTPPMGDPGIPGPIERVVEVSRTVDVLDRAEAKVLAKLVKAASDFGVSMQRTSATEDRLDDLTEGFQPTAKQLALREKNSADLAARAVRFMVDAATRADGFDGAFSVDLDKKTVSVPDGLGGREVYTFSEREV